mgnify:CR=1 FL=1
MKDGTRVIVIAVVGFAAFLAVGALTAPSQADTGRANGPTLVTAFKGPGADLSGSVAVLESDGSRRWTARGPLQYLGTHRVSDDRVLAAYQDVHGDRVVTGVRILTTGNQTVWRWEYEVNGTFSTEVHDAELLPNGDVLVAGMARERIFVVDRKAKRIVWQWNASTFYKPPADPTARDWLHINDVDRIGEDRYLVSVRNANQILVVERGVGVVEIINEDESDKNERNCRGIKNRQLIGNDPRCGDPAVLNHQHNPQWLGDGRVLVADSGNNRVVGLERVGDEWRVAWQLHSANGLQFNWPRDADRLQNGHTLVLDTHNDRVVEVTRTGDVVWSTSISRLGYAALRNGSEYPAGPPYYNTSGAQTGINQPFAVVSIATSSLQNAISLPYWIGEWHVLTGFAAAVLVLIGAGDSLWTYWRDRRDDPRSQDGMGEPSPITETNDD